MSYQVYESAVLPAPLRTVWSIVGKFDGSPQWSAVVESSSIEQDDDGSTMHPSTIGAIRSLKIRGVSELAREELIAMDQVNHYFTYKLLEAGGAFGELENYIATIKLSEVTMTNETFFEWRVQFNCVNERSKELTSIVSGAYKGDSTSSEKSVNIVEANLSLSDVINLIGNSCSFLFYNIT